MKIQILTGTLVFVLVVGLSPVFAQEFQIPSEIMAMDLPPIDEEDEIFDNGRGNFTVGGPLIDGSDYWADDFVLKEDAMLEDIHFDGILLLLDDVEIPVREFRWIVFLDDGGFPGEFLAEGDGVNESQMLLEELEPIQFIFRFWFDLDEPVFLEGGQTYWLVLYSPENPESVVAWLAKEPEFGNFLAVSEDGGETWETRAPFDFNFVLTGQPIEQAVAGELLPIDSTALFLAGLSQSMV